MRSYYYTNKMCSTFYLMHGWFNKISPETKQSGKPIVRGYHMGGGVIKRIPRQVPFPGSPEGSPGNGTWLAGTTLYRRNDSVGFFLSPVTIKLLQRIRTKTSFDQFCFRFIRIYRLLWSSARVRNELLTNHRRDIKTQGDGFIPCLMWSDIFSLSHYKIKARVARVRNYLYQTSCITW